MQYFYAIAAIYYIMQAIFLIMACPKNKIGKFLIAVSLVTAVLLAWSIKL
ncbi:MAG: hypothetical protein [Caudoviricetes sp.]|nr:MAG: hypothetical protein [Caudoviricetes sp.]